jgi:glycine dehydrogenase subunit 2
MSGNLIFDRSRPGRRGTTLPGLDVPEVETIPEGLRRPEPVNLAEVSELDAVRHYTNLSRKNVSIDTHFYPLGSCTMKYNPKFHDKVASRPGFAELHPIRPQIENGAELTQGALEVLFELEQWLCEILGFEAFTMQPLAGSHGELAGAMMIAAYHQKNGDTKRRILLIPDAAHGTNPASAAVAGFKVRELPTCDDGNVCTCSLKIALKEIGDELAGMMLTCPNTLGLYDPNVADICTMVHEAGGLMYGDGANLNAILGKVRPGDLGFDCMHVNLHKTFSTPHGGGGPGSGVVGVGERLIPFLPTSRVMRAQAGSLELRYDFPDSIGYIAPFYGNFSVILRAYAYVLTLGKEGLIRISENAVLNANYLRARLGDLFDEPYDRTCMHECVLSGETLSQETGVHALDLAKGLLDAGFHPPTIYFPLIVPECLMIEPTETESKQTLDDFADALRRLIEQAKTEPDALHEMPLTLPVRRLDETQAARHPDLASI